MGWNAKGVFLYSRVKRSGMGKTFAAVYADCAENPFRILRHSSIMQSDGPDGRGEWHHRRRTIAAVMLSVFVMVFAGSCFRAEAYDFHLIPSSNLSYGFQTAENVPGQDLYTGAAETVSTSVMGTAYVHSVEGTSRILRLSGAVRADNVSYFVVCFGKRSFQGVKASKVTIDLVRSSNKKRVIFSALAFAGAKKLETLSLKASSASLFGFRKNVFQGSKIWRIAIYGMDQGEFQKMVRKLKSSGFTGKIVRKG